MEPSALMPNTHGREHCDCYGRGVKADLQPELGRRLKAARLAAGLRQADLTAPGVTQSYISHLEAGRREPTGPVLAHLADRLGLTPAELGLPVAGSAVEWDLELALADIERRTGRSAEPRSRYERLIAECPDPAVRRRAGIGLAWLLERAGDLEAAVRCLEPITDELFAGDARDPDQELLAEAATCLSRCYREAGDLHRAVEVAQGAVAALSAAAPRPRGYAQLVATLAYAYTDRGDLLRASHVLEDLIAEYDSGPDRPARAAAYWNASLVSADRGRSAEALRMIERAGLLLAEDEDERALARIKITKAWLFMSQPIPDPAKADALLRTALPELERHASATDVASAHTELSRVALALGRPEAARTHALQAMDLLSAHPNLETARACAALGQALLALGDDDGGRARLRAAAATLTDAGSTREAAVLWRQLGAVYAGIGAQDEALHAYARALDTLGVRADVLDAAAAAASRLTPG
jgi:tetratricopeptide (TPR) repeat protein